MAIALLLAACAGSPHKASISESYDGEAYEEVHVLGGLMGGSAGGIVRRSAAAPMSFEAADAVYMLEAEESSASMPQARMVNYNGNVRMQSSEPEAVIDTVVERAKAKGGAIDNRRNGYVSLQIPVTEFRAFFDYILTLGHVTSKNISASDITDAFTDNAARLRIAESTLARLQELLATAKTEKEKITLLKEIQRVSEQIEQAKLQEKELLRRAAFSTINLWVSNIPQATPRPLNTNIKAFEWFKTLPNANNSNNKNKALKLQVPKDFIETENAKGKWSAASALNAKFWAFERKNEPQGTADFWANAMLEYFKNNYSAELKSEENFSLVRLQSSHPQPEIYYIAILKSSDKKTLKIAQAYFPNKEAEEKNSEAVKEVLRRAK